MARIYWLNTAPVDRRRGCPGDRRQVAGALSRPLTRPASCTATSNQQRHDPAGRLRQGARLRVSEACWTHASMPRRGRSPVIIGARRGRRHAAIHVARAGPGAGRRRAQRRLQCRGAAVRMLAGVAPFDGATVTDVLVAILGGIRRRSNSIGPKTPTALPASSRDVWKKRKATLRVRRGVARGSQGVAG